MNKPKVFVTRMIPEKGLRAVQEYCQTEVYDKEIRR